MPTRSAAKKAPAKRQAKAPASTRTVRKPPTAQKPATTTRKAAAAKPAAKKAPAKTATRKVPATKPTPAEKDAQIAKMVDAAIEPRNSFEQIRIEVTTIDMRTINYDNVKSWRYDGGVLAVELPSVTEEQKSSARSATVTVEQIAAIPLNRIYGIKITRKHHQVTSRNGKAVS